MVLEDFPPSPLDAYRKKSSFDWKEMKYNLEGEDVVKYKLFIWNVMKADPLFHRTLTEDRTWQQEHHITFKRSKRLQELNLLPPELLVEKMHFSSAYNNAISMYDLSLSIKKSLSTDYPSFVMRSNGTSQHLKYLDPLNKMQTSGCFALTEIAHGSNTKGMQLKAVYDPKTKEFVLHSPSFEASKCWAGNLGQIASIAVIYAQLYTPDGQCHGLHAFVVPIRDPKTLLPYPGVTVGCMGPKLGLNGLDNGFVMFNNYRIPRESLLNKSGDVSPDGKYISSKGLNERFGESLGALSMGRVAIIRLCTNFMQLSLPIAVRYSAVRKQFGPTADEELPVLEYQVQQWRLLPYVAAAYVSIYFARDFYQDFIDFFVSSLLGEKSSKQEVSRTHIHALSCCGKAVCAWIARDSVQECREACGGHGFLRAAGFGRLRNDNDANCTYEGDNNVILQQTSNYLLNLLKKKKSGESVPTYIDDLSFFDNIEEILNMKYNPHSTNTKIKYSDITNMFAWLVCYLLMKSYGKYNSLLEKTKNSFTARCNSQVYAAHTLAIAFFQLVMLKRFRKFIDEQTNPAIKSTLENLGKLYGLWSIEKHLAILYAGSYLSGSIPNDIIKEEIVNLCSILKDDAVALVDVLAPPDFILNSALGMSDGRAYEHLQSAIMNTPGSMERPYWWREFFEESNVKSKL